MNFSLEIANIPEGLKKDEHYILFFSPMPVGV